MGSGTCEDEFNILTIPYEDTPSHITGNPREWRHFFKLRLDKAAHPNMKMVAWMAFSILNSKLPALFSDIIC